jgi:predicted kinase
MELYVTGCTQFVASGLHVLFVYQIEGVQVEMRRRSRRAPNTSESTGKIGQELPSNQPAPLVPFYPDDPPAVAPLPQHRPHRPQEAVRQPVQEQAAVPERPVRPERHVRPERPAKQEWNEPADSSRFELETQPEMPSMPPPEPEAADRSPQAPKGYVVLAIGLPGSGKTTWFRRRGVTPLSSDLLRNILFDDVEEQRYQGLVFSTLRSLLRARLIARMPWNYVDATNLSIHERRQWIKMAKSFGYEVQAVFFDVPLDVCLERNSKRDRSVSEEVMRKMGEKLKPPVFEEGFAKITVVRVKSAS